MQPPCHDQEGGEADRQPEHGAATVEVREGIGVEVRDRARLRNEVLVDADVVAGRERDRADLADDGERGLTPVTEADRDAAAVVRPGEAARDLGDPLHDGRMRLHRAEAADVDLLALRPERNDADHGRRDEQRQREAHEVDEHRAAQRHTAARRAPELLVRRHRCFFR